MVGVNLTLTHSVWHQILDQGMFWQERDMS